jgi:hypothetical protein
MRRLHFSALLAAGALAFLSSMAPAAPWAHVAAAPSRDYACGGEGKPPCPMQDWMKANLAPAVACSDAEALARGFERLAAHAPPNFTDWAKISKAGAERARKKDFDGVKVVCQTCHSKYKSKYKEELRDRPL